MIFRSSTNCHTRHFRTFKQSSLLTATRSTPFCTRPRTVKGRNNPCWFGYFPATQFDHCLGVHQTGLRPVSSRTTLNFLGRTSRLWMQVNQYTSPVKWCTSFISLFTNADCMPHRSSRTCSTTIIIFVRWRVQQKSLQRTSRGASYMTSNS